MGVLEVVVSYEDMIREMTAIMRGKLSDGKEWGQCHENPTWKASRHGVHKRSIFRKGGFSLSKAKAKGQWGMGKAGLFAFFFCLAHVHYSVTRAYFQSIMKQTLEGGREGKRKGKESGRVKNFNNI